ncbi:hypothetical protein ACBZ91_15760 [Vibrio natriegens]|uniref:hypothetical protein n=1 Tax=Vibrio natriegens TaxID=691 RepID=UPI003558CF87
MAERIQLSMGYVSQVERGVSSLSIPTLQSTSDMLRVQIRCFYIPTGRLLQKN